MGLLYLYSALVTATKLIFCDITDAVCFGRLTHKDQHVPHATTAGEVLRWHFVKHIVTPK